MEEIIIEASDVWEYFQRHKEELGKDSYVIAERTEYGVVIALTEERGLPCFIVTADGYQYEEESAVSKADCTNTVKALYDKYLTERFLTEWEDSETLFDQNDMISERELELDDAVMALVDTILEEDATIVLGIDADTVCEDTKDHILEYLARRHKVPIRRPMVLEDEKTGEDFFTEYPYECMVFEDEDNPIYK